MANITYSDYLKKVKGCFVGKSVGGTLGMPFEGFVGTMKISYYDPVPTEMIANDDLDNQVIWLETIRRYGLPINHRVLGDAFARHVIALFDEYCIAVKNTKAGIYAPLSGYYDNKFTAGMGAAIRTEIWACLAPGDPALAAKLAREDSCLDHCDDGVDAAVFIAAVESAAFVESDAKKLVEIGLSFLNPEKRIHRIITDVVAWVKEGLSVLEIRELVLSNYFAQNWTDVGHNLGFIVAAFLTYGGDFSKGICEVTECGHDADCTCATLGSILGIINPDGIDSRWTDPIGDSLVLGSSISSIHEMETITDFCLEISKMSQDILKYYKSDISITDVPDEISNSEPLRVWADTDEFLALERDYNPLESTVALSPVTIKLVYPQNVAIALGETAAFKAKFSNPKGEACDFKITLQTPNGWSVSPSSFDVKLAANAEEIVEFSVSAPKQAIRRRANNPLDFHIELNGLYYNATAGLVQSIEYAHAIVEKDFTACPKVSDYGEYDIVNTNARFFPVAKGKNLFCAEFRAPYYIPEAILLVQGTRGVKVWVDDELVLEHDGAEYVPCVHRSEYLTRFKLDSEWHKLTVLTSEKDYDGTQPPNNPGNAVVTVGGSMPMHEFRAKYDNTLGVEGESELFINIGERSAYRWFEDIEWRLPKEFDKKF